VKNALTLQGDIGLYLLSLIEIKCHGNGISEQPREHLNLGVTAFRNLNIAVFAFTSRHNVC